MKRTISFIFFLTLFATLLVGALSGQSHHYGGGHNSSHHGSYNSRGNSDTSRHGGYNSYNGGNSSHRHAHDHYNGSGRGYRDYQVSEKNLQGELRWDRGELILTVGSGAEYLILVSNDNSRFFDQMDVNKSVEMMGYETGEEFNQIKVFSPSEMTQSGDTYLF